MNYYRIDENLDVFPRRWLLGEILGRNKIELDPFEFWRGIEFHRDDQFLIQRFVDGDKTAFSLAAFDVPIVRNDVASEMLDLCGRDVQMLPVTIGPHAKKYSILNMLRIIDCIDESSSVITRWGSKDGRPDKVGQYRMVIKLVVDAQMVGSAQIFRPMKWPGAILCSDVLRRRLDGMGIRCISYDPV
jgi:hypothetical protein